MSYPVNDPTLTYSNSLAPQPQMADGALLNNTPSVMMQVLLDKNKSAMAQADARAKIIQAARDAYDGNWGDALKAGEDGRTDSVKPNRCKAIVDTAGDLLFGLPLGYEVANKNKQPDAEEGDSASDSEPVPVAALENKPKDPWQEYVEQCWGDPDDMMTQLAELYLNGALAGHAFLKILTPQDTGTDFCGVDIIDSARVTVISDPNRCKTVQAYIIRYQLGDETIRQVISRVMGAPDADGYVNPTPLSWVITDQHRDEKAKIAAQKANDENAGWVTDKVTPWDYPFPPMDGCQHAINANEYWGAPKLTQNLIDLNKSIQFAESDIARIIKLWGSPYGFAFGVDAEKMKIVSGEVQGISNENAKVQIERSPADITQALSYLDVVRTDQDEEAHYVGALNRLKDMPRGQISGVALRTLNQPAIMDMGKQRRLYGPLFRKTCARFLVVGGLAKHEADVSIELHWDEPIPADDLASAQAAAQWKQIGVSTATVIRHWTDFDPELEAARNAKEDADQLSRMSKGMGLPAPTMPPMGDGSQPPQGQPGQQPPPQQNTGNAAALNSPKAQIQRAKVAMTAKG